jgi:photosystem II stability/assembly factor-like uncharacterized protein
MLAALLFTLSFQEPAPPPRPAETAQQPQAPKGGRGVRRKEGGSATSTGTDPLAELARFRHLGPAVTSGRVVGFAVHPTDRTRYFVAVASGGVWKTVNSGTTWTPVFDKQGSYSIGQVVMDPKNPDVIWVGTGENNNQRSVGYGDGVYKSRDGGQTWENVGLKASEHVGRIVIHPKESDTVYVAAQGPLWSGGGDRGLYRTADGGKTWAKLLDIDENTGVTDVALDPRNPDVILAATHQRRRHQWTIVHGGPGSGLHRSTDAGKTWKKVTAGLPTAELGRIGLAVLPADPSVVYATVEAAAGEGGVFRSTDFGVTWQRRNPFDAQAQYYSQPVADPVNKDRVYVMNTVLQVSDDGGTTLRPLGERFKHVDNHALWIDPRNPNYYLVGCDGGVYESFDRAANWHFKGNLPVTQFYDIGVDQNPAVGAFYHVYGGTQDNFTLGGPARTRSINGIPNNDWFVVQGGDGFHCAVDPTDPMTVYGEYQHGGLCRYDRRTGTRVDIRPLPAPGEPPLRWHWDSPLVVSPHAPKRLYFAANRLFRSDDRGDSWTPVSPDLSRQLDRDALPVMGKIWWPDAVFKHGSTSLYGSIVALAESPLKEGELYAGTDDGLIRVSDDGGKTWRKTETFPGVPERTYVSKLVASRHAAGTVYAAFDNHKQGDFKPYLLKTTDAGKTWASVAGDLPARGTVYAIAEDHKTPNLLFCGTEFGLFVTWDGGGKWQRLPGLPTVQVKDLAIQRPNDDLVVGTFGRGIYVLDDLAALRAWTPAVAEKPGHLFPTRDAVLFTPSAPLGGAGNGELGASHYAADNPPAGAVFIAHIKDNPPTLKQKREAAEAAARKDKKEPPYPKPEVLRAEAEEEGASATLTICDDAGAVVRALAASPAAGFQRLTWDFRDSGGFLAGPGSYTATLGRRVNGTATVLAGPLPFRVAPDVVGPMTADQHKQAGEFAKQVRRLRQTLTATSTAVGELTTRLEAIRTAADLLPPTNEPVRAKARELLAGLRVLGRDLTGDGFLAGRNEATPVSVGERVQFAANANRGSVHPPTGTQKQAAADAAELLTAAGDKLRAVQAEAEKLEQALAEAGVPYSPPGVPK